MLTDDDKQWIAHQIASQITAGEARMMTRLGEAEERMSARMEKTETALLTEFHKWASPVGMRQRTHAAALRAVDAEMEALTDRA